MSELKKFQCMNITEFTRKIVDLVKSGAEIDLSKTISLYGKYYMVHYVEPATKVKEENSPKDEVVEESFSLEDMSDEQLRNLAKEAKLQGWKNMKRENLVAKLSK